MKGISGATLLFTYTVYDYRCLSIRDQQHNICLEGENARAITLVHLVVLISGEFSRMNACKRSISITEEQQCCPLLNLPLISTVRMHCKMVFNFHSRSRPRFQELSYKMTAHWSKKLDPYWSIEDMMKTNKSILSHPCHCK